MTLSPLDRLVSIGLVSMLGQSDDFLATSVPSALRQLGPTPLGICERDLWWRFRYGSRSFIFLFLFPVLLLPVARSPTSLSKGMWNERTNERRIHGIIGSRDQGTTEIQEATKDLCRIPRVQEQLRFWILTSTSLKLDPSTNIHRPRARVIDLILR